MNVKRPFLDSYYISMTHFRHFRGELRLILHTQDGPMYKQQFPMYNSIWPKIGLGPFLYSGTQLSCPYNIIKLYSYNVAHKKNKLLIDNINIYIFFFFFFFFLNSV